MNNRTVAIDLAISFLQLLSRLLLLGFRLHFLCRILRLNGIVILFSSIYSYVKTAFIFMNVFMVKQVKHVANVAL